MPHDLSGDLRPFDDRLSADKACITMNQPNLFQFDQSPNVSGQASDLNCRTSFDPILLPTCFNNRVQVSFSTQQISQLT